ncbi:hypothetical protein [Rhodanobacter geophilus]|uniref:Uncharacterized protein n=1 Tax=Rhodanobacter geophilus TaxID=3162488 RepID=A0ABV3QS35_9GAMM
MNNFAKMYSVPLIIIGALAFFPHSSDQWHYSFLLAVSFLVMAFFGHVGMLTLSLDGRLTEQTFFLKCCIGQIVLLLLWLAVSPLVFIYKVKLGLPLNLPVLISFIAAVFLFYKKSGSSFVISLRHRDWITTIFLFFAMACIFKIASYYSYQIGAIGLDTHEHIYWTNDLYDASYLRITARGTNWLDQYPKGLHALAALWGAPGLGNYLGPALKIMPALQMLLITFAFGETLYLWLRERKTNESMYWIWLSLVLLISCYETFHGSRLIYPNDDLNSTGRISSAAIMLLPGVVGLVAAQVPSRRMVAFNWMMLPLCGALAVKINPSLSISFIGFSFFVWLSLAFYGLSGSGFSALKGLLLGGAIGLTLIITDPYYLNMMSLKVRSLHEFLSYAGVDTLESAEGQIKINANLLSRLKHFFTIDTRLLVDQGVLKSIYPNSDLISNPGGAVLIKDTFFAVFFTWIVIFNIKSRWDVRSILCRSPLITFTLGLFAGCLINVLLAKVAADTIGVATHDTLLLASYAQSYVPLLTLFLAQILCVLAITMLTDAASTLINRDSWTISRPRVVAGFACVILIVFAAVLARVTPGYLPTASKMDGWRSVSGREIREFRRVENMVPINGLILAEAVPAELNDNEKWIIPVGRGAALLPFARGRYVFNVKLGTGEEFSYKDLHDKFCTGNARSARRFLRENNVRYLFSPGTGASTQSKEDFLNKSYCNVSYRDLGVVYPAFLIGKYGIAYYKIQPD